MLVDDNDDLRETMTKLLSALTGVEVVGFSSGAAALRACATAPGEFELVVSDLDMPGMNGIEFCRLLHQLQPQVKVLLATGSSFMTTDEARDYGFCGMVNKPFSVASLRTALAAAMTN